jgi:hypothetical protein
VTKSDANGASRAVLDLAGSPRFVASKASAA